MFSIASPSAARSGLTLPVILPDRNILAGSGFDFLETAESETSSGGTGWCGLNCSAHAKHQPARAADAGIRPAWCLVAGLCPDPGSDVAHRSLHHYEGKTDHATGLGNVVRASIVAIYVTI
jgi:hypothetical protein